MTSYGAKQQKANMDISVFILIFIYVHIFHFYATIYAFADKNSERNMILKYDDVSIIIQ